MSNLRDLNQQNPFVDLLASFNSRGADHPFFAAFNPEARDRGAPPSYGTANPSNEDQQTPPSSDEEPPKEPSTGENASHAGGPHHAHHQGPHHRGPHHRGGHWGRGGWGAYGRGGGRCGRGGPNHGPWGMAGFDVNKIADFISHFAPEEAAAMRNQGNQGNGDSDRTGGKDFTPDADIFDTEDAYVVHMSLPGAKKEDVGVNWDADSSELNIAGVIYRLGDEEFLKKLALDERKVGVFERKIKLGSKQDPAQVESDGIAAKMEDGILVVTIPKTEKEFVEVKKVDIE